jgi:hypothetical protein
VSTLRARPARAAILAGIAAAIIGCGSGSASSGGGGDAGQPWLHLQPRWASLYDGYFGPSGVASCANGSTCHSTLAETGGTASNFICPDKDACFTSLTGASHLIRTQDVMDPASTPFLHKLRQAGGSGRMPSNSTFTFQPEDIDLLQQWIGEGAKND